MRFEHLEGVHQHHADEGASLNTRPSHRICGIRGEHFPHKWIDVFRRPKPLQNDVARMSRRLGQVRGRPKRLQLSPAASTHKCRNSLQGQQYSSTGSYRQIVSPDRGI